MNAYVKKESLGAQELPLEDGEAFLSYLTKFTTLTDKGKEYVSKKHLGFDKKTGKLITMKIQAQTFGKPRDSRTEKLPVYDAWESFLDEFSETAPKGLQTVF